MSSPAGERPRRRRKPIAGEEHLARPEGVGHWRIDFTIDGNRFRESTGTEDKAAAAAFALKRHGEAWREIKLGEKPRRDLTMAAACVRYYEEVCKGTSYGERCQRYNMRLLAEALGKTTLLAVLDDNRIAQLVQHFRTRPAKSAGFREGVSPATINRYITTLSVVCRRAKDVWGVEVGPWVKAKHIQAELKNREVFATHEQAKALLDGLAAHARPIVLLDMMTGLRRENVVRLAWETISLDLGRLFLIQKGGKRLVVDLVPEAVQLLQRVEPDPEKRKGAVWRFGNASVPCECSHCRPKRNHGKPITSIRRSFTTAAAAAGLRDEGSLKFRFHDLRHSFASWLIAETGNLKMVQEALGHGDIKSTARYVHLLEGQKRQAIAGAVAGLLPPRQITDEP
jgi:integrase